MDQIFYPQERAILLDYFGLERPAELRDLDIYASASGSDDPNQPVLVEPNCDGAHSQFGIPNAVARLLLSHVQKRLPQWAAVTADGRIVLGREHRKAKTRIAVPLPQFLFEINWADSGPGISWPEAYYVAYVPGFARFSRQHRRVRVYRLRDRLVS